MNPELIAQPLITVPNSLKAQLDRAQNLLTQSDSAESNGDHALAMLKAREGMRVLAMLARTAPENSALLIGAEAGYRGFEFETIERVDRYQIVDRKILGITVGNEIVNLPTITRKIHRGRLF